MRNQIGTPITISDLGNLIEQGEEKAIKILHDVCSRGKLGKPYTVNETDIRCVFWGLREVLGDLVVRATEGQEPPVEARCDDVVDSVPRGAQMAFTLTDGEPVEAMCVDYKDGTAIYMFVDALKDEYPLMNESGDYPGWDDCDLRKTLNTEILARFPKEIRENMVPFPNGDYLRIPTEKEIFGVNEYGVEEPEEVTQFEPMKKRRNRIAFQGLEGDWNWYWLANRSKKYATDACFVTHYGNAYSGGASYSLGVRPLFGYRNIPTPCGGGRDQYVEKDARCQRECAYGGRGGDGYTSNGTAKG